MIKTKIIFFRHAHSEANLNGERLRNAMNSLTSFTIPSQDDLAGFDIRHLQSDSALSVKGFDQLQELSELLARNTFWEVYHPVLVLHSPYVRAKETCFATLKSVSDKTSAPLPPVIEYDDLKEASRAETYLLMYQFRQRILSFECYLRQQILLLGNDATISNPVILIFGHGTFFRTMLGVSDEMKNCDVWQAEFHCLSPVDGVDTTQHLEPSTVESKSWSWTNVDLLYRLPENLM
jgi:broad specificity phosphatase PhoE